MKKGSDYIVRKFVYRSIAGVYWREDYHNVKVQLHDDFPYISSIASLYSNFRLTMKKSGMEITAWKDKYNNIIIRIIDQSYVQSQIDF